ncbi:uncharacterized protein B0H18DRAFT_548514 [Fomitopsis serialis]|uniref:uncharacterized protein n=1 Tax=Fomitopsis serialis TaxID=139415 RepID=UPI002007CF2F|nr:uncharacterized protein B0H18DRAFT_548514 [Neoantrodia serialis]KAH9934243.1 hypothetical protein B0H18DRAFT_548514 [Neoantrodia serialis]
MRRLGWALAARAQAPNFQVPGGWADRLFRWPQRALQPHRAAPAHLQKTPATREFQPARYRRLRRRRDPPLGRRLLLSPRQLGQLPGALNHRFPIAAPKALAPGAQQLIEKPRRAPQAPRARAGTELPDFEPFWRARNSAHPRLHRYRPPLHALRHLECCAQVRLRAPSMTTSRQAPHWRRRHRQRGPVERRWTRTAERELAR